MGVCRGECRGVHKGAHRGAYRGYHLLSLSTVDLVGDNQEFEV